MARKTSTTPEAPSTPAEATPAPEQTPEASTTEQTSTTTPKAKAEPKPLPTPEQALATAKADPTTAERFARVLRVVAQTKDGRPARVVVPCEDPQTKQGPDGQPVSVCEGEREIATQDLFQVRCCAACAERLVRLARRQRTKNRLRSLRAQLAEAKAALTA